MQALICTYTGFTSMPAHRSFHDHHQQSEFATVAGGNYYQGGPNMRNDPPNIYPRGQFDQQQGYNYEGQRQHQPHYDGMHQQPPPVRDGAQMSAPPTNQGGVQEITRLTQQSKPVIKSKQELS